MKVSILTASRVSIRIAVCRVSRVRLGLASQASRVFLPRLAIHTALFGTLQPEPCLWNEIATELRER